MKLHWQIIRLQLKETFSISYGEYTFREALIVSLHSHEKIGYGECSAIDYYGINLNDFSLKLQEIQAKLKQCTINHPIEFYHLLESLNLHSFLRSAIDCAYWDLFGKLEGKSFLEMNNLNFNELPQSSITISIDSIENQMQKIKKLDWDSFKVKCNHFNETDLNLLLNLEKNIAIDANCSFTLENCIAIENNEFSKQFTYIEQPLPIGVENFSRLSAEKHVNWMADEDCLGIESLVALQTHFRTINIKLVKVGGLTPALQMIKKARELGFKIMIGCMTESTVGISAGAVLVPLVDYVDLDGANLIANDIANGSFVKRGFVHLLEKEGLGISIK